ncbi:ParB/RepB/Spo0J family partition protein [Micromonospora haikouensis]|uniref:ParB/RepB/Spo0J family partition protein n=1 Tax=Micromonospora haikouensis TaxID=686309 RepID=UPI00369D5462
MATTTATPALVESDAPSELPGRYTLLEVEQLRVNPRNYRDDAAAMPGIVENLEADGVRGMLAPVIVTSLGDDLYELVDGEQRYRSAIEARQTHIQAIVRDDLAHSHREQTIAMLRSVHRKDPTAAQQARGIQQLALDGMTDEEIADRTGFSPDQVKAGRSVDALDEVTAAKAHAGKLDFTQFAVVAEFADDPQTAQSLIDAAAISPFEFSRKEREIRNEHAGRKARDARRDELSAAGVTLLDSRPPYGSAAETLSSLCHDGKSIDATEHRSCPGHAVYVTHNGSELRESAYCTQWRTHGHTGWNSTSRKTGPMTQEQKAERRTIIENNKAMEAANTVRREFVAGLFGGKTAPKGATRLIAETLIGSGHVLSTWINHGRERLDDFLHPGKPRRTGTPHVPARSSDARCTIIALAAVAAAHEQQITRTSWRSPDRLTARWLEFLTANGYHPGAVEQIIIDAAKAPTRSQPALPNAPDPAHPDGSDPIDSADPLSSRADEDQQAEAPEEGGNGIEPDDTGDDPVAELDALVANIGTRTDHTDERAVDHPAA